MKTLYIERSTGECRDGEWVEHLDLDGVERIVVGTGPGSFAGIRSAIAFAQGYALGRKCEVLGLPSSCALVGGEGAAATGRDGAGNCNGGEGARPSATLETASPVLGGYAATGRDGAGNCSGGALAAENKIAVVGDSRRGMAWVALFDGFSIVRETFQVKQSELKTVIPEDYRVTTPDENRIGALLGETFGERYLGGRTPSAEGLKRFAEANPAVLRPEPLPIYLNPAVR